MSQVSESEKFMLISHSVQFLSMIKGSNNSSTQILPFLAKFRPTVHKSQ